MLEDLMRRVYLELRRRGVATVGEIAEGLGVGVSEVEEALEALGERGCVAVWRRSGVDDLWYFLPPRSISFLQRRIDVGDVHRMLLDFAREGRGNVICVSPRDVATRLLGVGYSPKIQMFTKWVKQVLYAVGASTQTLVDGSRKKICFKRVALLQSRPDRWYIEEEKAENCLPPQQPKSRKGEEKEEEEKEEKVEESPPQGEELVYTTVHLPKAYVEALDRLVRSGRYRNRSEAVRRAIAELLDRHRLTRRKAIRRAKELLEEEELLKRLRT